jgi:hypothetical protein
MKKRKTPAFPYLCGIMKVPEGFDFWVFFDQKFYDTRIDTLTFRGCRLFPYWECGANNNCRPKPLPALRLIVFTVDRNLSLSDPEREVVAVFEGDPQEVADRLSAGVPLNTYIGRNQIPRRSRRLWTSKSAA